MYELTKMGRCLRVNLLGLGPRVLKKRVYQVAVSQKLRNTGLRDGRHTNRRSIPARNKKIICYSCASGALLGPVQCLSERI